MWWSMNTSPTEIPLFSPDGVEYKCSTAPVDYRDAVAFMEERVAAIAAGDAAEIIWFLEHPPLYSAGTSARAEDLVDPDRFPVFKTGRGGQYTYHGPGQRVVYFMLDLKKRGRDVRAYVCALENLIIETLENFDIDSGRRDGRVGVWVNKPDGSEAKIAALGVRLRHWVSFHGISINVNPDLSHFGGIVPCGIAEHGVTSLADLGSPTSMTDVDQALKSNFEQDFGPLTLV